MSNQAWQAQSTSLIRVQEEGGNLEKLVKEILGWESGEIIYDFAHKYKIQVDAAFPNINDPQVIVSVTYTNPDKKGHSNENKFQLKVGELALQKNAYPGSRVVLAIGGSGEAWLPYVLEAFQYFFDEVIFLWEEAGANRLREIAQKPLSVPQKNPKLWTELASEWQSRNYVPDNWPIPNSLVRYQIADILKLQGETNHVQHPQMIKNEIARKCMYASKNRGGIEWDNYLAKQWNRIEMSRNYFNPNEAIVETSLEIAGLQFSGSLAVDVEVHSLLHDLGMESTSVSEDFVLFSQKLNLPVYIQCKASGGGREQHGKNIQNRTKEQITRSLLYRCRKENGIISMLPKEYHWISILDGDWGVNQNQPLKYIHMLQMAGYDKLICVADLLDTVDDPLEGVRVKRIGNPLITYLVDVLDCKKASRVDQVK